MPGKKRASVGASPGAGVANATEAVEAIPDEMSLPESEVLELSDTLHAVVTGVEHYERATLLCLAPMMLELSNTVLKKPIEDYTDAELRAELKGIAESLFKSFPDALKTVDKTLETLELEFIRKNRT